MSDTIEKTPRQEAFDNTITQDYPLHQELQKMDNMAFLAWLESEIK